MNKNDQSADAKQNAGSRKKAQRHMPRSEEQVGTTSGAGIECDDEACRTELTEEFLTAEKQPVLEGEVRIHKEVESDIQSFAVDAAHDEVYVEHRPINQEVSERRSPWREDDVIVVPVYEEQVVVTRRLVLKEELLIRRVKAAERKQVTAEVRRERPVIEEYGRSGMVHEVNSSEPPPAQPEQHPAVAERRRTGG